MKSRHQSILEWLNQHEFVTVGALAKALNSSVETIRRDLKHLDRQGLLCSVHGGAKRNTVSDVGAPLNVRQRIQVQEKRNIACRAFKLLQEDMVIGIDASSTTLQLAKTLSLSSTHWLITSSLR
nr:DeoR/GlpR family DNA-binding transcription regulator [uncultured Vibrio sp.]